MSRDQAREALIALRKMLAQGKNPNQERKLERIRAAPKSRGRTRKTRAGRGGDVGSSNVVRRLRHDIANICSVG